MKRILATAALLCITVMAAMGAGKVTPTNITKASDSKISWIGRTQANADGSVSFDWTATTVRVAFTGDYLAIKATDTGKNYYNVWIDSDPSVQIEPDVLLCTSKDGCVIVNSGDSPAEQVVLASNLKKGEHKAVIKRKTEGSQGRTTVCCFLTHGEITQAEGLKPRMIEFIGDSYTCGYGSENSGPKDPFTAETENSHKTYAAIVARYFDADYVSTSHSGQGVYRNYNGEPKSGTMPQYYRQLFNVDKEAREWVASEHPFKPAVSVIYLGTNDYSRGLQPQREAFIANYIKLIKSIKANYGENHPVIVVSSKIAEDLFDAVRDVAAHRGLKNITYTGYFKNIHYDDDRDLGASWHPSYSGHIKLAYALIPYISTVTGWELTEKTIK